MNTAYISHPACRAHDMGPGHPEQPQRLDAIADELQARGLFDFLVHHEAPRATVEQLARVHTTRHIDALRALAPADGLVAVDPDTRMGPGTWEAALRAAGANILATDLVIGGDARRAFCSVRPPGHHAERARAMGFCFFNNVAVGVAHALAVHGLERIAIADFDVHFGNGTADIFADDPRVLLCSLYEHPLFPGVNPPSSAAGQVNCAVPAGSGGDVLRKVVTESWLTALDRFRPQLLFISAGFDAAAGDPLAGLRFQAADFEWLTQALCAVAANRCDGRIVSTLEGGYDLVQLARCTAAHIERLMNA